MTNSELHENFFSVCHIQTFYLLSISNVAVLSYYYTQIRFPILCNNSERHRHEIMKL